MCLKEKVCPICKKIMKDPPALSRVDNKTEICSSCGTKQALEAFIKAEENVKKKEVKVNE